MSEPSPQELMESAWAARRRAWDLPESERRSALAAVRSDLERASELLRRARSGGSTDTAVAYAHSLHLRAHVEWDAEALDEAERLWSEAVGVLRAFNAPLQLAHKLRHLGDLHVGRQRFDEAEPYYEEALEIYRAQASADSLDMANALRRMALLREATHSGGLALPLWREARALYAQVGLPAGVQEADEHIAQLQFPGRSR